MNSEDKENQESKLATSSIRGLKTAIDAIDDYYFKTEVKPLHVTYRNGKFACQCGFNVIHGHNCQDIVAVHLFRNNSVILK